MNKYGAKKAQRGPITFDSQKEAARYDQLVLLERAGEIRGLRLQPEFTLQEAFTTPSGEKIRAIRYRADFAYEQKIVEGIDTRWAPVVEDVKGVRTQAYVIKRKLMLWRHGIRIREI